MIGGMQRRALLTGTPFLLAAGAAQAAAPKEKKEASGQYVDISPVALPVVVDERLINYVFVHCRLNLTPSADAAKLRAKEPYFRDALVRAAHRNPFTNFKDYTRLDEARLKSTLLADANRIAGARQVTSVTITAQTPKQRSNLPRPRG